MGIVPENTELAEKPEEIKSWDALTAQERQLFEVQMETFAGFMEHTDVEIGRLVEAIDGIGELDNTLFVYIMGDNGSSAEGGLIGTFNELVSLNGIFGVETVQSCLRSPTTGAALIPSHTWRQAGRWQPMPPLNGPSRWRVITAAPETAW